MSKNKLFIIVGSIIAIITAIVIFFLLNNKKNVTYNISFETNGGSLIESQVVNEGEKVKKPIDPTKDGYVFVEWIYQGKTYDFSLAVTSNLTLTAKWTKFEESVETFVVKFETDGGTMISNQIVEKGNRAEKPADPVKNGYVFKGWLLNNEIYDFEGIVEKNIELKAKWVKKEESNNNSNNNKPTQPIEKKYTVIFDSNGGSSVASQTVEDGSKVTRPANPTRSGYNFERWTLNGNAYNFDSSVTSDITLVAQWTQKSYVVSVTRVDAYSPDSFLSVFEDGKQITVQAIKYKDGTYLCSGTNTTVNIGDIEGETSFIVVLSDGMQVIATVK